MSQGLGNSFDRAQREYDAQMPPEEPDCSEPCPNELCHDGRVFDGGDEDQTCAVCRGEGKVWHHKWRLLRGETKDGSRFAKCAHCGKVEES